MLYLDTLNQLAQERHNEFAFHGLFLPPLVPVTRLIKGFHPQFRMLGLNMRDPDPKNPGVITLSIRGLNQPENWLKHVHDTAWNLLSTKPRKHWSFNLRDIRQNKSVPYDYVHWVYEEAGHPLTFIVEPIQIC